MGTQGLVTVQDSDGKVLMKIVTGTDGNQADSVASAVKAAWPMDADDAYDVAFNLGFGNDDNLVVITENEHATNSGEELNPLYRSTFDQPRFNPRWEHGTADFISVVTVATKRKTKKRRRA